MIFTNQISALSQLINIPTDLIKTAIMLILTVPISILYRYLNTPISKNIASIILGCLLLFFIIELKAIFIILGIIFPYLTISLIHKPLLIMVSFSIVYLIYIHGERYFFQYSEWRVDCSAFVMFLVTKLTYYAKWLEQNGYSQLNFLNYAGYTLFYPGIMAGPTFSYEHYLNYLNNLNSQKFKWKKALSPLLPAIFLITLTIILLPVFDRRWVLEDSFYLSLNFIQKILIINFVGFAYRVKYYTGWYFAQTATNISGLSQSQSGEFDAATIGTLQFQIESNPKKKTEMWNTSLQIWLKKVVYDSIVHKIGPELSVFITFLVSAFWHGIHLCYYTGFIMWGILIHITKWVYKWSGVFPSKIKESFFIRILVFVASSSLLNFIGMTMMLLDWNDSLTYAKDIHYWGVIVLVIFFGLTFVLRPPKNKKNKEEKHSEKAN